MHEKDLTSRPADLIKALKGHHFLDNYRLTLFRDPVADGADGGRCWSVLAAGASPSPCGAACPARLGPFLQSACENERHLLFTCPAGLPAFAFPIPSSAFSRLCIVGCGVREPSLDVPRIDTVAAEGDLDPLDLLVQIESFPVVSREEFEETVRKTSHLLSRQLAKTPGAHLARTTERLQATVGLSSDLDRSESPEATLALLAEALGVLFDVPGIATAQPSDSGEGFLLRGVWGPPMDGALLSADDLIRLFSSPTGSVYLEKDRMDELFPGTSAGSATCLPLATGSELLGVVALLDTQLHAGDLHLAELLVGRAALRLAHLRKEADRMQEADLTMRFLTMFRALAQAEQAEDLYRSTLEMAAGLVQASCGSLMFIDETGQNLRIVAALGMNPSLARSLCVRVGTGMAGKVAASGHPLLVNDIEKDIRVATQNRPRFKTRSFISLPLRLKGRTMGVLNLSDKSNGGMYTERDLEVLLPFVEHAAVLADRIRNIGRTEQLERLSATDALTEVFNRRFLGKRLEEELNRARRHGLQLTLMMVDLDNFKMYNDMYGHPAGDKVLKRTARILQASVRDMDVVTRYGGEEFCILLPDTGKKQSLFAAERIRRGIEKERFVGEENLPAGAVTTSIGIASYPEDGDTAASLIKAADVALYQAKGDGKNRIVFFSPCAVSRDSGQLEAANQPQTAAALPAV